MGEVMGRQLNHIISFYPGLAKDPRLSELTEEFAIGPLLLRKGKDLSHGERQRWALFTALIKKPKLLLLDEPENGLDIDFSSQLSRTLHREIRDNGLSMLVATHFPQNYPFVQNTVELG
ncbi:MAG TPA: ATP-binding cassette domain-containing protein [candidate division UBP10 bacterium]|nr:ATP-binding cassette domain-containing protein [Candidatus Binatota bacterium]